MALAELSNLKHRLEIIRRGLPTTQRNSAAVFVDQMLTILPLRPIAIVLLAVFQPGTTAPSPKKSVLYSARTLTYEEFDTSDPGGVRLQDIINGAHGRPRPK